MAGFYDANNSALYASANSAAARADNARMNLANIYTNTATNVGNSVASGYKSWADLDTKRKKDISQSDALAKIKQSAMYEQDPQKLAEQEKLGLEFSAKVDAINATDANDKAKQSTINTLKNSMFSGSNVDNMSLKPESNRYNIAAKIQQGMVDARDSSGSRIFDDNEVNKYMAGLNSQNQNIVLGEQYDSKKAEKDRLAKIKQARAGQQNNNVSGILGTTYGGIAQEQEKLAEDRYVKKHNNVVLGQDGRLQQADRDKMYAEDKELQKYMNKMTNASQSMESIDENRIGKDYINRIVNEMRSNGASDTEINSAIASINAQKKLQQNNATTKEKKYATEIYKKKYGSIQKKIDAIRATALKTTKGGGTSNGKKSSYGIGKIVDIKDGLTQDQRDSTSIMTKINKLMSDDSIAEKLKNTGYTYKDLGKLYSATDLANYLVDATPKEVVAKLDKLPTVDKSNGTVANSGGLTKDMQKRLQQLEKEQNKLNSSYATSMTSGGAKAERSDREIAALMVAKAFPEKQQKKVEKEIKHQNKQNEKNVNKSGSKIVEQIKKEKKKQEQIKAKQNQTITEKLKQIAVDGKKAGLTPEQIKVKQIDTNAEFNIKNDAKNRSKLDKYKLKPGQSLVDVVHSDKSGRKDTITQWRKDILSMPEQDIIDYINTMDEPNKQLAVQFLDKDTASGSLIERVFSNNVNLNNKVIDYVKLAGKGLGGLYDYSTSDDTDANAPRTLREALYRTGGFDDAKKMVDREKLNNKLGRISDAINSTNKTEISPYEKKAIKYNMRTNEIQKKKYMNRQKEIDFRKFMDKTGRSRDKRSGSSLPGNDNIGESDISPTNYSLIMDKLASSKINK